MSTRWFTWRASASAKAHYTQTHVRMNFAFAMQQQKRPFSRSHVQLNECRTNHSKEDKISVMQIIAVYLQWSLVNDYVRNFAHKINCMHLFHLARFTRFQDSQTHHTHSRHQWMRCFVWTYFSAMVAGNYTRLIFQMWMGCVQLNRRCRICNLMPEQWIYILPLWAWKNDSIKTISVDWDLSSYMTIRLYLILVLVLVFCHWQFFYYTWHYWKCLYF